MTHQRILTAIAISSLLLLGACNSDPVDEADGEVGSETVATLIEGEDDLTVVAGILGDSGLQGVFDGNAPYTILAPTDAAFAALDIPLQGEEAGAARVAILREHILPGYLTRADIIAAIEQTGGSVEMQTMGSNTLTFTGDADELLIASSDGTQARVADAVLSGVNGSIIPIDAVLKSMDAPE